MPAVSRGSGLNCFCSFVRLMPPLHPLSSIGKSAKRVFALDDRAVRRPAARESRQRCGLLDAYGEAIASSDVKRDMTTTAVGKKTNARLRLPLSRVRSLHRHAADGRVRSAIALRRLRLRCAARVFRRAVLRLHAGRAAQGPGRQRTQPPCTENARLDQHKVSHGLGCGCCSPKPSRRVATTRSGAKSFPTARPWMISH
jgi:hypothetical protein